ncbi:uncharacterized protein LOC119401977 isoform X2 [Rhipicephalus sanguineus]|nr:uncharacterized protein LOC119401977 isoform X2 [Rhipicephalus sanguineus]XP_037524938.1 uncharacterized protein LOC119401977 isoform X2 [Rhipicephalus sanguineus]
MATGEIMMAAVQEFGDPEELVHCEHCVTLKLESAWATEKHSLPDEFTLSEDKKTVTMKPEDMVTNSDLLGSVGVAAALFAGCDELTESNPVLKAAQEALKNVTTIVVVHNRNLVSDLITWFPAVTTIVLYHDLKLQHDKDYIMQGLVKHSHLERLLGTTPALGADYLLIMPLTSVNLHFNCPKLEMLRALNLNAGGGGGEPCAPSFKCASATASFTREEALLGCTLTAENGQPVTAHALSADEVAVFAKDRNHCSEIKSLRLTSTTERGLEEAGCFSNVTQLSLNFASETSYCPFYPHIVNVLSRLTLESLRLSNVTDVSVSAIAKHCRGLECLGLGECVVLDEEIAEDTEFQCLRKLRVGRSMSERTFFGLLRSCPSLAELQVHDDDLTTALLLGLPQFAVKYCGLDCLERLALRTDPKGRGGLAGRQGLPDDLDRALTALPALRIVRTDDFRVRLHMERCAPWVRLEWYGCTVCLSEYPKMDSFQEQLWLDVHHHVK